MSERFLDIKTHALRRKVKKIAASSKATGVGVKSWAVRSIKEVTASLQNQQKCGSQEYEGYDETSDDEEGERSTDKITEALDRLLEAYDRRANRRTNQMHQMLLDSNKQMLDFSRSQNVHVHVHKINGDVNVPMSMSP